MLRHIFGFTGLSRALAALAVEEPVMVDVTMIEAAKIIEHNVKKLYGDATRLESLSAATLEQRENTPLLIDGSLLRDHVYSSHTPVSAEVGTSEVINAYHEFGYVDARGGSSVVPRPVFKLGLQDSRVELEALLEENLGILIQGRKIKPRYIP